MRVKVLRIVLISLSLLLLLAACQDEVVLAPIKTGSSADFPNSLGLRWEYTVLDNLQPPIDSNKPFLVIDTNEFIISGYSTSPSYGSATIWSQQRNKQPVKEKLAMIKGDTVYFVWNYDCGVSDSNCYFDKIGLVFPFSLGDSWATGGIFSGDRTTVIDTTSMTIAGSYFTNVFVLENERRTTVSSDKRKVTLWFVPNFGITKIHVSEQHAGAVGDTSWTLLHHNNPNF
jgi:hypothetical protein